MTYVKPQEIHSPKAHWHLFEVIIEESEGKPAYALGTWDEERRVGLRWNGSEKAPLGNPQSRGLATWTMLDPRLHPSVVDLVEPERKPIVKAYLGLK